MASQFIIGGRKTADTVKLTIRKIAAFGCGQGNTFHRI